MLVIDLLDELFSSVKCLENIEQLEEERRLFYVACTRAKKLLYLTLPSYMGANFTLPSRFLVEVDEDKYEALTEAVT